jgi:hypothetical protein
LHLASVGVALFLGTIRPGAAAEVKFLKGHVPSAVAHLPPNGILPETRRLNLAIGLPLHDRAGLDELLRQLYDPASPNFHKFLTPEEFTARFGPTEADYAAVKDFARTNGLVVTATYGNRLLLDVAGPAAAVEKAFHITLRTYRHPTENRDFFAPDTEPTVDAALPVVDVQGLSDFSRPHPKLHRMAATATPRAGSAPGSTYMGNDFRAAYVPGSALNGSGQMVGLLQFDGFYTNDIAAYETLAGRTNIPLQTVLIDYFSGTPTGTNDGNAEVSLDIEMTMSMAPALAKIIVFEGNPSGINFIPNDVLDTMAASNTVKNLSSSWGWSGGPTNTTDNIFVTMMSQGQSFFNASGDSDAFTTGAGSVNGVDNPSLDNVPSSNPYITQVGGTTLTMNGTGASYASETVWNWGNEYGSSENGVGSSGGVSTYYSIPTWQQGINSFLASGGSSTARNIPDVALTADNVYVKYGNGTNGDFGGTSCAAPLWAGFMALVNQQAAASGKSPVGFINPAVYEIANESVYNSAFNDVTTGNNTSSSSPNAFYAVPGYDLCTGLGTPAGTNLINALVNPDPLVVVSNVGFSTVKSASGAFNIASQTFYLTNVSASSLIWSLVNTSSWLNVSTAGGTLAAGAGGSVAASLNNVASNLTAGIYTANLWFSNVTSGVTHYRLFTLTVADALVILPTNNFSFAGPSGGPFTPASQSIILTNERSGALSWAVNNTSSWFNVSPANGGLSSGAQTNLTITPAPAATNLPIGNYTAILLVTNLTSQSVQTITCGLLVQPLVQNGGFETGDFTDWTLIESHGTYSLVDNGSVSGMSPHSGAYFAALGHPKSLGLLSQTLATTAGQTYLLSLWLDSPTVSGGNTPNEFKVSWNGNTLFDQTEIPAINGWTNLQFIVTATGTSTVLQFGERVDPWYFGLDDVSATPVFPPVISTQPANLTILSGSNAVFSVTATGSTNLVYQWRKNGINFANGGNISGATSNVLTFTAATTNNSGSYSVVVTNVYGSATSSVAVLAVGFPPAFQTGTLTVTNNYFKFAFNTVSGAVYQILFKTNLLQASWITSTSITATNAATIFVDTNPVTATPQKFYRISWPQ